MTFLRKSLLFAGIPTVCISAISVPLILSSQEYNSFGENEQMNVLEKVGLYCGRIPEDGSICKANGKTRLKLGGKVEEGIKFSDSSTGKLVLRKSNPYSHGFRFSVEEGDIDLVKADKTIQKLKRFESFGIEDGGVLVRKANEHGGVMMALGLPSKCNLPMDGATKDCFIYSSELGNVHFEDRKEGGATIANPKHKTTLKVSKSVDTNLFKEGYRFSFYSTSDEITINNDNVIRIYAPTEFTVKEWKDENMVLVRAAGREKEAEFFKKVGLTCDASTNVCDIEEGKLSIIQGKDRGGNRLTLVKGKKAGGEGKIKLHRDQPSYTNGLEFFIENGDINIVGSSSSTNINKLSDKDGYEILETGGQFYLNRKCSNNRVLSGKETKMGFCKKSERKWI